MSLITDIIAAVNASVDATLQLRPQRVLGLTEIIQIDGRDYPVLIGGTEGVPVTPDDGYALTLYWREIDHNEERVEDRGYGNDVARRFDYTLRLYGIGYRKRLASCGDVQYDLAATVRDAVPRAEDITITGEVSNLEFTVSEIATDTGGIMADEYTGHSGDALNILKWTAFYLTINLRGYYCGAWCDIGAVTIA